MDRTRSSALAAWTLRQSTNLSASLRTLIGMTASTGGASSTRVSSRRRSPLRRCLRRIPALRLAWGKATAIRTYWRLMVTNPGAALRFLLQDPEVTNFTYEIDNVDELCKSIARWLGIDPDRVRSYAKELVDDNELKRSLETRLQSRWDRKQRPLYGRRIGWYCITRLTTPSVIIETGVADGLGSSVLLRALQRNAAEGRPGRLYACDIDTESGWIIPDELREAGFELLIGPSLDAITRVAGHDLVDLFIHDSDHRRIYEMAEYETVESRLAPRSVVLSDNAEVTDALEEWSGRRGRRYDFWREHPVGHFYPGGGIGVSLPPGGNSPADSSSAASTA